MSSMISESLKEEMFKAETSFFFEEEDSKIPNISFSSENENNKGLMFRKNGICYFLNNDTGHVAYNKEKFWQLSKREFLYAKKCVLEMLKNCSLEFKLLCLKVLDELNYEVGKANAYFEVKFSDTDKEKVQFLRFNFRNYYYLLSMESNVMTKGNVNSFSNQSDKKEIRGLERKLVLGVMKHSKTIKDKISAI